MKQQKLFKKRQWLRKIPRTYACMDHANTKAAKSDVFKKKLFVLSAIMTCNSR